MRHTRLSNMLALALLAPTASYAQVLYSNYGPGDSYSQGFIGGTTFAGYGKSAARFVPPIGGEFDRVETSLGHAGDVTLRDLFDYLSAWFAGCP